MSKNTLCLGPQVLFTIWEMYKIRSVSYVFFSEIWKGFLRMVRLAWSFKSHWAVSQCAIYRQACFHGDSEDGVSHPWVEDSHPALRPDTCPKKATSCAVSPGLSFRWPLLEKNTSPSWVWCFLKSPNCKFWKETQDKRAKMPSLNPGEKNKIADAVKHSQGHKAF